MTRSKRSSGSPPEFFADRCLGKGAPRLLISRGWLIHVIGDHFPDDAQHVSDPNWIEYGLSRGWALLTQDLRISPQVEVRALLRRFKACNHCLDSSELAVQVRADRFDNQRGPIHQSVLDRRNGFFVIHEKGPPRRKR
ncbi:hypothetical protein ACFY3U_25555 [Micromonospora sp. NPDC000089]|uniref:PIN-like domain-containing protein n=1 Tax=unclassified Micromonospora TaxID=2617518 RepID=UPI00369D6EBA